MALTTSYLVSDLFGMTPHEFVVFHMWLVIVGFILLALAIVRPE